MVGTTEVVWREEMLQWLGTNHRTRGEWLLRMAMTIESITPSWKEIVASGDDQKQKRKSGTNEQDHLLRWHVWRIRTSSCCPHLQA